MTSELTVQLALQAVHAADAALVFEDHCSEIGFDWSVEVHYPRPVYRSAPLVAREHVGTRQAVGSRHWHAPTRRHSTMSSAESSCCAHSWPGAIVPSPAMCWRPSACPNS